MALLGALVVLLHLRRRNLDFLHTYIHTYIKKNYAVNDLDLSNRVKQKVVLGVEVSDVSLRL